MAVTNGERPIPSEIQISQRMTPNGLRALKQLTGMNLTETMNDEADRLQALIFMALIREGYHPTWEEAGDVAAIGADDTPDPTPVPVSES